MKKSRWPEIALIGAYPPPYGGIGIHLQRLADRLEKEGANFTLYNTVSSVHRPPHIISVSNYRALWLLWFCLRHRCKIVHLVTTNWLSYILVGMAATIRSGKYIISIHNMMLNDILDNSRSIKACITRWLLRKMDTVIACNQEIEQQCADRAGVRREHMCMIPAFIPPDPDCAEEMPAYIQQYIDRHTPLLCATSWVGKTYQGSDLYGVDMMMELVSRLKRDYPDIGLILTVLGGDDEAIKQTVESAHRHVGDRILMITEPLDDFSRIVHSGSLFLRPTNTDGDAVSVREALHLGTPVIASDVVSRPDLCITFRSRDIDDFEEKVRQALKELPDLQDQINSVQEPDNADRIIDIYNQLLEGQV